MSAGAQAGSPPDDAPLEQDVDPQLYAGRLLIVLRRRGVRAGALDLQLTNDGDRLQVVWRSEAGDGEPSPASVSVVLDRAEWARWLRTGSSGQVATLGAGAIRWLAPDLRVAIGGNEYRLPVQANPSLLRLSVM